MRILVTGAAGPLGRHVVTRLLKDDHAVIGMVRRLGGVRTMESLGAEAALGDPRNPSDMSRAAEDCEVIIHLAGYFDFWEPTAGTFDSVNVGTTRNVLAAALRRGTRRTVVCSSALTIGEPQGSIGDEFSKHRGHTRTAFERSKLEAERLALKARQRGLEVVVVNPGMIVSPRDPGWLGRLFVRTVSGERPLLSTAPMGWVWVEDAAEGVVRAAVEGTDGARYILSAETLPIRDVMERVASSAGVAAPRAVAPGLALAEATLATAIAMPLGRRPRLAIDEARFLASGFTVDGTFATHELGLEYTPASQYLPTVARDYVKLVNR